MPEYLKSHIVYEFFCPVCNNNYTQSFGQNVTGLQSFAGMLTF